MKKILNNRELLAVLTISLVFCICLGTMKAGMDEDEVVTYGLANSYYATWFNDIDDKYIDGDMTENVITRSQVVSYLTVDKGERFAFGSVFYNQSNDVHPPLYYCLLHFISSFCPNVFSKWVGLSLNICLYLCCIMILFLLCDKLFKSKAISATVTLVYSLSLIGLSTMLFIRMYILLTLLTILLAYEICLLFEKEKWYLYIMISLTILAGFLTQYNYVYYAFFLCAICTLWLLLTRRIKQGVIFAISSLFGALSIFIVYPPIVQQIIVGANNGAVSGESAVANLLNVSAWAKCISDCVIICSLHLKLLVFLVIALSAFILLNFKISLSIMKDNQSFLSIFWILFVPALIAFCAIVIISPGVSERYVYHITPIFALLIGFELFVIKSMNSTSCSFSFSLSKPKRFLMYVFLAIVLFSINDLRITELMYLGLSYKNDYELVDNYKDSPCIYVDAGRLRYPHDQSLQFLIASDDFYIARNECSDKLINYVRGHNNNEKLLIYFDTEIADPSSLASEIVDYFDYTNTELLFETSRTKVFLLSK